MIPSLPTNTLRRRSLLALALSSALPIGQAQAQGTDAKPDAARFFRAPQMLGAVLAPDGRRLAMRSVGPQGRVMLTVLQLDTLAPKVVYNSDNADVGRVVWVNNDRLAFDLSDRETPQGKIDAGPGLFAVDQDGASLRQLVERQTAWLKDGNDTRRLEPWNTFLLNGSTLRQGDAVMAVRPEAFDGKDMGFFKLLRLDTRNGRSETIDSPLHSVGWWPDVQGNLRVALTRDGEKAALRWKDPATDQWRALTEFNAYTDDGDLQVRHVGADGQALCQRAPRPRQAGDVAA